MFRGTLLQTQDTTQELSLLWSRPIVPREASSVRDEVEIARRANYNREHGVPDALDANNPIQATELRIMHDQELLRHAQYDQDNGPPDDFYVIPAAHAPSASPGAVNKFPAFSRRLQTIRYPKDFKPAIEKYDGRSDSSIWLKMYSIAAHASGGNEDHMAGYFPLVIGKEPLLWLDNLPTECITSWATLSRLFMTNYQATYNRPGNTHHLARVRMRRDETPHEYTNCYFENRNTLAGVKDKDVISYYKKGITNIKLFENIHEDDAHTISDLMAYVNKLVDTQDAVMHDFNGEDHDDGGTRSHKRSGEDYVADPPRPSTFLDGDFNIVMDDQCQFHCDAKHTMREWDLDVVGPFRTAPGGYKHILVAVDIFTKWIEVRPVAKVTLEEAVKFIGDIKHRFGVPNRIITDLGAAFTGSVFCNFCQDNLIDVYYSSVAHPRCNCQVERDMVLQALKDTVSTTTSPTTPPGG
jgi:hypothetical protein